jgi:hypothetical protein
MESSGVGEFSGVLDQINDYFDFNGSQVGLQLDNTQERILDQVQSSQYQMLSEPAMGQAGLLGLTNSPDMMPANQMQFPDMQQLGNTTPLKSGMKRSQNSPGYSVTPAKVSKVAGSVPRSPFKEEYSSSTSRVHQNFSSTAGTSGDVKGQIVNDALQTSFDVNHVAATESETKAIVYTCDHCDFFCSSKEEFQGHAQTMHGDTCIPCDDCNYKAKNRKNLKRHTDSVHAGIRYPCDYCDYHAKQKYHLKAHIETKHGDIFFYCEDCPYKSDELLAFKKHLESAHGVCCCPYEECYYKASNKKNLKRHVDGEHARIRFPCELCNYEAKQKYHLKSHMQSVHGVKSESTPQKNIQLSPVAEPEVDYYQAGTSEGQLDYQGYF